MFSLRFRSVKISFAPTVVAFQNKLLLHFIIFTFVPKTWITILFHILNTLYIFVYLGLCLPIISAYHVTMLSYRAITTSYFLELQCYSDIINL